MEEYWWCNHVKITHVLYWLKSYQLNSLWFYNIWLGHSQAFGVGIFEERYLLGSNLSLVNSTSSYNVPIYRFFKPPLDYAQGNVLKGGKTEITMLALVAYHQTEFLQVSMEQLQQLLVLQINSRSTKCITILICVSFCIFCWANSIDYSSSS